MPEHPSKLTGRLVRAWKGDIRLRLYGGIVLVVLASAMLYTLYAIRVLEFDAQARMKDKADRLVTVLGSTLARPMFDINTQAVQSVVEAMGASPDVAHVAVYSPDGLLQAGSGAAETRPGSSTVQVMLPVSFVDAGRTYQVGRVELTMLATTTEQELRQRVQQVILVNMLLAGAIVLLLYALGRQVARPMADIQAALEALAAGKMDIQLSGSQRPDQLGRLSRAVLVFRDVLRQLRTTEDKLLTMNAGLEQAVYERTQHLREAVEQVRASREQLQAIVDTATDAVILTDEVGVIHGWNARATQILGWQPETAQGQMLLQLLAPSDESGQVPEALQVLAQRLDWPDQTLQCEATVRHQSGRCFPVEWAMSLLNMTGGPADATQREVCVFIRDISERRKAEADIRSALERKTELYELRSRFISMASHEFRTPLTSILSSVELMRHYRDRMDPGELDQLLSRIEGGVQRMTGMLDRVLVIGQADADKLEFVPRLIDLPTVCHSIVLEAQAQHPESPCRVKEAYPPPGTMVVLDESLLRHILGNLMSNALKYSPEGGDVELRVGEADGWWEFVVADHGIGIPASELPHLFASFHRASNVAGIKGTGLGLAIVQRSVDLHGGQISVDSQLGQGSRFVLRLPVDARSTTA